MGDVQSQESTSTASGYAPRGQADSAPTSASAGGMRGQLRSMGYADGENLMRPGRAPGAADVGTPVQQTSAPPAATVDAEPLPAKRKVLRIGTTDKEVKTAQARLNDHGADPTLAVDAIFGPQTNAATVAFQRTHGLTGDGVIESTTWAALDGAVPAEAPRRLLAGRERALHGQERRGRPALVGARRVERH